MLMFCVGWLVDLRAGAATLGQPPLIKEKKKKLKPVRFCCF